MAHTTNIGRKSQNCKGTYLQASCDQVTSELVLDQKSGCKAANMHYANSVDKTGADRKKKLAELKAKTRCTECNEKGHWAGDDACKMKKKNSTGKIAERQKILDTSYSRQRFRKSYKELGSSSDDEGKKKMQVPAGFGLEDSRSICDAIRIGNRKESGKGKKKERK